MYVKARSYIAEREGTHESWQAQQQAAWTAWSQKNPVNKQIEGPATGQISPSTTVYNATAGVRVTLRYVGILRLWITLDTGI